MSDFWSITQLRTNTRKFLPYFGFYLPLPQAKYHRAIFPSNSLKQLEPMNRKVEFWQFWTGQKQQYLSLFLVSLGSEENVKKWFLFLCFWNTRVIWFEKISSNCWVAAGRQLSSVPSLFVLAFGNILTKQMLKLRLKIVQLFVIIIATA